MNDFNDPNSLINEEGKPHIAPPVTNQLLRDTFGYGISDLNQNAMGRPSPAQRDRQEAILKNENDALWLMLMIFLGMTLLIAFITLGSRFESFYIAVGSGIVTGGLWLSSTLRTRKLREAIASSRAKRVIGEAFLTIPRGLFRTPTLVVKDQSFKLTLEQASALAQYELGTLRVYYLEGVQQILAAETFNSDLLDDEEEKRKNDELDDHFLLSDEEEKRKNE